MRQAFRRTIFLGGYFYVALFLPACTVFALVIRMIVGCERRRERLMRRAISLASRGLINWLQVGGALELDCLGIAALRDRSGVIFAANHPTFIDAIFLFAFLEEVFCVVKSSLRRDVLLSPITHAAGYLPASAPLRLIQECGKRLRRGENLLLFPEGTRSRGPQLHRFKAGFTLVARRANAPVQAIHIESKSGDFLRKGSPFFDPWQPLPLRYRFRPGQEFVPETNETTEEFLARVEGYFRGTGETEPVDLARRR